MYHCVQLNSFPFSSVRRIGPCCRPSQTNIRWNVADCAIYTAWSSVLFLSLRSSHIQQSIDSQWCVTDCVIYSASSSVKKQMFLALCKSGNFRQPAIRPESRFLPIPHLHSTPPLGGFPWEYGHPVWYGKTRMVWLPDGEKNSKISLFVLTWSTNVIDRQTDRRTTHDGCSRAYA